MAYGALSPDWQPLAALLETILRRIQQDLREQDPVCLAVTAGHGGQHGLVLLASLGDGESLVEHQVDRWGGPVLEAIRSDTPVASPDLWRDPRWPRLTRRNLTAQASVWERIVGAAAVASGWDDGGIVVVSCCLASPADERTTEVLCRYENLVVAALAVAHASTVDGPEQMLRMLRSRAVIEQAKGAIMAVLGCDAETAWQKLRAVSQHTNVKLRDLAVAVVEHIGQNSADHPAEPPHPRTGRPARLAAAQMWEVLSTLPPPGSGRRG